ncbi:MAG TPA: hypothetical protein VM865_02700 [Acidobacteriaceae bacterium]|jgi:hypothetical protein|nr:hypothetical protein [Acidobacteriaceae bacterium]
MNGPEDMNEIVDPLENEGERARAAEFEQAIARALRRIQEPAGLTDAIMERLKREAAPANQPHGSPGKLTLLARGPAEPSRAGLLSFPKQRAWMGGAIAAVLAIGIFAGERIHQQHERRIEAQRQFETAERITDQALEHAREQMQRAGISLGQ